MKTSFKCFAYAKHSLKPFVFLIEKYINSNISMITMNIFVFDNDVKICAKYHCDSHVIKMILESAQMLSTAHHLCNSNIIGLYRPTHINHPCTKWVMESSANYLWLYELFCELSKEFESRYGKIHKSYAKLKYILANPPEELILKSKELTPFAQAMPDDVKHTDAVTAYRNYFIKYKRHIAQWKNGTPSWYS